MKYWFPLLVLFVCNQTLRAQDKLYYSESGSPLLGFEDSVFYSLPKEHTVIEGKYKIKKYYLSGDLASEGLYHESDGKTCHGSYTSYYRDGLKQETGEFGNGLKVGKWEAWYPNGKKRELVDYDKGSIGPLVLNYKVMEFYDANGKQLVKKGKGLYRTYYKDYVVKSEGNIKKGIKTGSWKGFYDNGRTYYYETYSKGKLKSGTSYSPAGKSYKYDEFSIGTTPSGGFQDFYKYVSRKMRYPAQARRIGVEGKVYVQFDVNEEGKLTDVKVLKGIGAGCDAEAVRVISNSDKWASPIQRGQKTKQRVILPLAFKLG